MTFKLIQNPTFRTKAVINVPTDAGQMPQSLNVRFKALAEECNTLEPAEFLRQAVLDISDVVDEAGQQMAFTPELLEQLLAVPYVKVGLVKAYYTELSGAKLGN